MNLPEHDKLILVAGRCHSASSEAPLVILEQWTTWQAQFELWASKASRVVWFNPQKYHLWRGEKTDSYELRAQWALEQPETILSLSLAIGGVNWENSTKQAHGYGIAYQQFYGN
jgi:hypothetical protein